jgi:hypothetical protein
MEAVRWRRGRDTLHGERDMHAPEAPAEVRAVAALFASYPHPWAICGGWAVDLYLGRVSRAHSDVDVAVLRRDQATVRSHMASRGWTLEKAHAGTLTPWAEGEVIELPLHGIWCRNPRYAPDFVELLLNEADGPIFCFRRDRSIRLPLARAFIPSSAGIPILAPEIALLYKSAGLDQARNVADVAAVMPALEPARRAWLRAALASVSPGHPWLGML